MLAPLPFPPVMTPSSFSLPPLQLHAPRLSRVAAGLISHAVLGIDSAKVEVPRHLTPRTEEPPPMR